MPKENCLEDAHVHMGETLKRDVQDLAMRQNRAVGDYSRAVLEAHVYGAKGMLLLPTPTDQSR